MRCRDFHALARWVGHLWLRLSAAISLLLVFALALAVLSYAPQTAALTAVAARRSAIGWACPARLPLIWCCSFSAWPFG